MNNNLQTLNNCFEQITANKRQAHGRSLYNQALAEAMDTTAAAAPVYEYKDMWTFPEVDKNLTYHTTWGSENYSATIEAIMDVLYRFGLPCNVIGAKQGPTLNRFFLSPSGHTKVSSVTRLENDFRVALNDSSVAVRIEDGSLVVEVPRTQRETVYFGDMARSEVFRKADKTALAIGMDIDLNPVVFDLKKAVHILIAGQTGSGKSVLMHNLVLSLLMKNTPADLHMHIIDPKMLEFSRYSSLPLCSVTTEVQGAVKLLESLCREMDSRYNILSQSGSRDIDSYNEAHADCPMRREVVIIDELADLMNQCGKAVEGNIARLAQKARACGIHLIIATQYPVRTVVTGLIKQNIPTRICLSVSSTVASMVALDMPGGEDLIGNGDMLFLANGALKPMRLQGGYVSEEGIANIVGALNQNVIAVHQYVAPVQSAQLMREAAQQYALPPIATAQPSPAPAVLKKRTSACGITAIVCGVIGIVFWFLYLPAVIGLIFGIVALFHKNERKSTAIIGTVLSLFALAIPAFVYAMMIL